MYCLNCSILLGLLLLLSVLFLVHLNFLTQYLGFALLNNNFFFLICCLFLLTIKRWHWWPQLRQIQINICKSLNKSPHEVTNDRLVNSLGAVLNMLMFSLTFRNICVISLGDYWFQKLPHIWQSFFWNLKKTNVYITWALLKKVSIFPKHNFLRSVYRI